MKTICARLNVLASATDAGPFPALWRRLVIPAALSLASVAACAADSASREAINPGDVFNAATEMQTELVRLSCKLGTGLESRQLPFVIENATPREVWEEAFALFTKADQLAYEHTYTRETPPQRPVGDIRPADVIKVVRGAFNRILLVSETLGLEGKPLSLAPNTERIPSDAFMAIAVANKQINLLLEHPVDARDIYIQINHAISYSARLLSPYPEAVRIPDPDINVIEAAPSDVFAELTRIYNLIRSIAANSDTDMLDIRYDAAAGHGIDSSDVYDLATLIVTQLSYLHAQNPELAPAITPFDAGPKSMAEVRRQTSRLRLQLSELHSLVTLHVYLQ